MGGGPVLIVGAGFLGHALADRLRASGDRVVLASRHRPEIAAANWVSLDVRDAAACRRVVDRSQPRAIVLAHGPSDITWCEAHPDEAMATHATAAKNLTAACAGIPKLLVSTDNVFGGDRPRYFEDDSPLPANAYGRAKLAAEAVLGASSESLVLRASLVYGWRHGGRTNFFDQTARALAGGSRVEAPADHWNTPVLARDVAEWTAALMRTGTTGVVHLGGPDRVSRYEWARLIAEGLGYDPGLVAPVAKDETTYACRPVNACLGSNRRIPNLDGPATIGVRDAIEALRGDRAGRQLTRERSMA